jgi:hypothetical protein
MKNALFNTNLIVLFTVLFAPCDLGASIQQDPPEQVEPPRSNESDPPKSLDELLGIDGGSQEDGSLLDDRDKKNLDDRLDERELSSELESAISDMNVAAEIIARESYVGLDLQRLQKSIIARLDAVIDEAKRNQNKEQSSSSSSSSSSSESEPGSNEPPANPSGEGGAQSTQNSENPSDSTGPDGESSTTLGQVQAGNEGIMFEESDVEWGRLPKRVREVIRQGMRESISRRYRSLTEAYYRRLAEEASK